MRRNENEDKTEIVIIESTNNFYSENEVIF